LHFSILFFSKLDFLLKKFDFIDISAFLINPNPGVQFRIDSIASFFKIVMKSFLVILLIDLFFAVLIATPLKYFNLFPALKEFSTTPVTIFKITILIPIMEELVFRLPLRVTKVNLLISLSIVVYYILSKLIISNTYFSIIFTLLMAISGFLFTKESTLINSISAFVNLHFLKFFYLQALVFGFLHLTNYNLDFDFFYLFPLFIMGYLFVGCLWGYLRVRYSYGIYICITSHIIINSIYCIILF